MKQGKFYKKKADYFCELACLPAKLVKLELFLTLYKEENILIQGLACLFELYFE